MQLSDRRETMTPRTSHLAKSPYLTHTITNTRLPCIYILLALYIIAYIHTLTSSQEGYYCQTIPGIFLLLLNSSNNVALIVHGALTLLLTLHRVV